MKKKSDKVEKEVERDEEEDEEDAEGGADSDEEEAEERPAVSARAVADERRARRIAAAAKAPKKSAAHDDHGHDHDDEEESADSEDPSWWLPHAVMSVLVLIGVLGFFGTFNKILAPLAAHPAGQGDATTKEETKAVEPAKAPTPTPPMPVAPQAPREMFAAKHLLVMYKGGKRAPEGVTRTKEEAKARATEAQKKAKDGKIKFEDLVKEYSDEPRAGERGGDLGTFPKGSMVPEFQAALDKMKIGEISDVVETPFGFHVILRTAPAAPAMPPGH
jgi:hypothetical protein